jgi:hypothetical protein
MNGHEDERFEAELRRLTPAQPPAEWIARLEAAQPVAPLPRVPSTEPQKHPDLWGWLWRWVGPVTAAAAAALVALLIWWSSGPERPAPAEPVTTVARPTFRADDVEIDQHLVASYDAVARLPGGEPVRFRCREWMDQVTMRDSVRGLAIERRKPRLELVPVSLDTY